MTSSKKQMPLRLPPEIDREVTERASKMGVSKNSFILMVLSREIKSSPVVGATGERN